MEMSTFDYIVVGAGSAGCAVANRLSESGRSSVLLLEAGGPDRNPWIHIPMGFGKTIVNKKLTWNYSTAPSPGLGGRTIFTPSGKVLGGSSSINGLVYTRGQREDFDSWQQDGNLGWSYDEVLPFFRKSEDQENGPDDFHGSGGPLSVSNLIDRNPLSRAFTQSALNAGFPSNDDFNGSSQEGVGDFQMTARVGKRASSAAAFLASAKRRRNFTLKIDVEVEKLLLENGRVIGVSYTTDGHAQTVAARQAVILSAGAINSPVILQRSGIGRGQWLQDAGVQVQHELRGVGANLHDHVQARLVLKSRRYQTLNDKVKSPLAKIRMGVEYLLFRRGPLTSSGAQVGGFLRTRPDLERPDILVMFMPFSSTDYRKGLDEFSGFSISAFQLRPQSRGSVRLRSDNRMEQPVIQPNYLVAESDQQAVLTGLRIARAIAATDPLRREIEREERPGIDISSDDELLSYIRSSASSVYHACGTCKMGSGLDAVVDSRLRLRGLEGLVVADASIMPSIVSGPTNATAIMIGERAASFLLEDA